MSDQNDFTSRNGEEEDPCSSCTDRVCEAGQGCDYQNELDKMLGIYSYREEPMDFTETPQEKALREGIPLPSSPLSDHQPKPNRLDFQPSAQPKSPARRGRPPAGSPKSEAPKRKQGAQPGNLNALKHGLYVQGNAIHNTSPLERAQLFDLNTAVNHYKDFINLAYEKGMKLTDIDKINDTLRNLSLAAIALTRLLNTLDNGCTSYLPFDRGARINRSMLKLIDYYNSQIDSFMGVSDTAPESAPDE
jgi:hypothetical protein